MLKSTIFIVLLILFPTIVFTFQNCSKSCPSNSVCLSSECKCEFGFTRVEIESNSTLNRNSTTCAQFLCSSNTDCIYKFGSNSACSQQNVCTCDSNHSLDVSTQKCKDPLGSTCSTKVASSCGEEAFCNSDSICKCKFGFIPAGDLVHCQRFKCSNSTECLKNFGEYSKCQESNECQCLGRLDLQSQICIEEDLEMTTISTTTAELPNHTAPQQTTCKINGDCNYGFFCVKGFCRCPFGQLMSQQDFRCYTVKCDSLNSKTCPYSFSHSKCNLSTNECECSSSYHLNSSTQECVPGITSAHIFLYIFVSTMGVIIALLVIYSLWQWFSTDMSEFDGQSSNRPAGSAAATAATTANQNNQTPRRIYTIRTSCRTFDSVPESLKAPKDDFPPNYYNIAFGVPSTSSTSEATTSNSELPPPPYEAICSTSHE